MIDVERMRDSDLMTDEERAELSALQHRARYYPENFGPSQLVRASTC